jgi:hypothetical protein
VPVSFCSLPQFPVNALKQDTQRKTEGLTAASLHSDR